MCMGVLFLNIYNLFFNEFIQSWKYIFCIKFKNYCQIIPFTLFQFYISFYPTFTASLSTPRINPVMMPRTSPCFSTGTLLSRSIISLASFFCVSITPSCIDVFCISSPPFVSYAIIICVLVYIVNMFFDFLLTMTHFNVIVPISKGGENMTPNERLRVVRTELNLSQYEMGKRRYSWCFVQDRIRG